MMAIIILEHSGYDLVVLNKDGWIYLHTIIYPIQKKCFKQHLGVWQLAILLKIYIYKNRTAVLVSAEY